MNIPKHAIFQNAWVVDDLEAAALAWVEAFNLGPFFLGDYGPEVFSDMTFRGKPVEGNMRAAIAQAGPIQVELIQPLTEDNNAYRHTVKKGQTAMHHMAYWCIDIDAELATYEARSFEINTLGVNAQVDARFAYVDTHDQLSCMIELLEYNEELKGYFDMIAEAAANWDRSDPLRYISQQESC